VPEQKKKKPELLTLKESHLQTLEGVIKSSEQLESLRRDIGVLGWKMKTLGELLIKNEPFSTSISAAKQIKSLSRSLTRLEQSMARTAIIVDAFVNLVSLLALTAGSPSESDEP
jgi:hypothetical protein